MSDRAALYAAVLAAPDDDTPRLVYADYLDDTGARADAIRARFIRNQVALARAEPWSEEHDRLYRATIPVEDHYAKVWATGTEEGFARGPVYSRGFLSQVTCDLHRFLSDGTRLFAAQPVRGVKFVAQRNREVVAELASSPLLARLHTVHLVGEAMHPVTAERLARSPHAAGLRTLRVQKSELGAAGVAVLARLTRSSLVELDLDGNSGIGEAEIENLTGAVGAEGLRVLDLSNIWFSLPVASVLATAPQLARLEVLRLAYGMDAGGTPIRGPGAVALAESIHLRGLKELDLRGQELRKRGSEAFAAAYAWPGLRRLGLRGNGIPGSAIPAFAANPLLRSLTEIDLRSNDIKAEHLAPLRKTCPHTRILTDDTDHPIRLVLTPEDQP